MNFQTLRAVWTGSAGNRVGARSQQNGLQSPEDSGQPGRKAPSSAEGSWPRHPAGTHRARETQSLPPQEAQAGAGVRTCVQNVWTELIVGGHEFIPSVASTGKVGSVGLQRKQVGRAQAAAEMWSGYCVRQKRSEGDF